MIEALDPTWVGFFGMVVGSVTSHMVLRFVKHSSRDHDIADAKIVPPSKTEWDCTVWETRHKEAHPFMGDGDPLPAEDMTVCADEGCPNCLPTRKAIGFRDQMAARRAAIAAKSKARRNLPPPSKGAPTLARLDPYSETKRRDFAYMEARRLKDHKALETNHKPKPTRVVNVEGVELVRPTNVPAFAEARIEHNAKKMSTEAVWYWIYDDGTSAHYRQMLQADEYEVGTADGTVKRWRSIYDPETGKYLGDYSVDTLASITASRLTVGEAVDYARIFPITPTQRGYMHNQLKHRVGAR